MIFQYFLSKQTCALMDQYKEVIQYVESPLSKIIYSAPEVRKQCPKRDIYFNVGFYENE